MKEKGAEAEALFTTLRRFVRARPRGDASLCELCGKDIGEEHPHLLLMKSRTVACTCQECAILFSGQANTKYRRIPRDARWLDGFAISDVHWDGLGIPIGMAYFCVPDGGGTPRVFYPSPAGAMESLLSMESWSEIAKGCMEVREMEPEVEALLVIRLGYAGPLGALARSSGSDNMGRAAEYYIAPIDECYRLVGLIRSNWRGFSGGEALWQGIGDFFASLKSRAIRTERPAGWAAGQSG